MEAFETRDSERSPSERELQIFALLLPIFFTAVGALCWYAVAAPLALAFWIAGVIATTIAWSGASARRRLHRGWMRVSHQVAFGVSVVLLTVTWVAVVTPVALILRLSGRDPMCRHLDRSAQSYWIERGRSADSSRYFRQF